MDGTEHPYIPLQSLLTGDKNRRPCHNEEYCGSLESSHDVTYRHLWTVGTAHSGYRSRRLFLGFGRPSCGNVLVNCLFRDRNVSEKAKSLSVQQSISTITHKYPRLSHSADPAMPPERVCLMAEIKRYKSHLELESYRIWLCHWVT